MFASGKSARRNAAFAMVWAWALAILGTHGASRASAFDGASADAVPKIAQAAIEPGAVKLTGKRATAQLIVTGTSAKGELIDLTRAVQWTSMRPEVALVSAKGQVTPVSDGEATIVAKAEGIEAKTSVRVEGMGSLAPVSFHLDVIPAFSQASCNMGACHGTPTGKGGFRLSLRGYLPDQDHETLTREAGMRRINVMDASTSMVLRKPMGELPHEGGLRLQDGSKPFEMIRDWIAEGAKNDADAPKAVKLEILPSDRVLHAPMKTQQVAVRVTYSNGSSRDVTPLCYYDSSSPEIAEVAADGYVTFKSRGEAAIIAHYLDLVAIVRLTHLVDVPGFQPSPVPSDNIIDKAIIAKLNRMRIAPSEEAADREFIRRAYLDVIGVLPTPEEVDVFVNDKTSGRYDTVIDGLMNRGEFYDYWTLKFADVLRSNGRLIQPKGAHVFTRWIRSQLQADAPMDQFVRDLLTAKGSTYSDAPANYYRISRDPENAVETTAQLFLGVRIQCAKCHNHPFERWTQDDYYGFAAFFARVRQKKGGLVDDEVIYTADGGDVRQPRTGQVMKPKALGGPAYDDEAGKDRREKLAVWLTGPRNPFFAKSLVNRVWFHLMGRGIVEPVDDFRDSNPASNDELLNGLADDFVRNGYSLKKLVKTIVTSRAYRASAKTNELNKDDSIYFSHSYAKLLPAEVLLDAISTLTATSSKFNGLPDGSRAVQISDGTVEDPFLKTFGRPARELACECERESDSNLSQALQLIGGATVNNKLRDDNGRMAKLAKSGKPPEEIVRELYRVALSRDPGSHELDSAVKHINAAADKRQAIEDLGWVLINSKEFLFRH